MSALERWSLICKVSAALITDIQPPPARGLNYDALNQTWRLLQLEPFHTIWDTTSPLPHPISLCAKYLYLKPVRKLLPHSPSHPLTPFSSHLNLLLSEIVRVVLDKNVNTGLVAENESGLITRKKRQSSSFRLDRSSLFVKCFVNGRTVLQKKVQVFWCYFSSLQFVLSDNVE